MTSWHGLAASALIVTVALGIGFAFAELGGRRVPVPLGLVHGLSAFSALALMGAAIATGPRSLIFNASLLVAAMAALVGLLLFAFRIRQEVPPAVIVLFHGAMGLVAAGLILRAVGV